VLSNILQSLENSYLYIIVDETTDRNGLQICNLLIGKLCEEGPSAAYLVASKQLDKTDSDTVMAFIDENLGSNIFVI
jgi:hypothetical protein